MGFFKSMKALKAMVPDGSPDGQSRHKPSLMEGFGTVMANFLSPMMAWQVPERGRPLPATEPAALAFGDAAAVATGQNAILARDSAFDPALLTTFANQVFAAVAAVWSSNDPAPVRSVLADHLWEPLAAAAAANQATAGPGHEPMGITALAAMQQGQGTIAGVDAGQWYDSVTVAFTVSLGEKAPPMARDPWAEEWLFQRSVEPGGDPMAYPEKCPTCGTPTDVDKTGACTHCRTVVPMCTSGWLVSRIECHNPFLQLQYDEAVGHMRQHPDQLPLIPAAMRQLLPSDMR